MDEKGISFKIDNKTYKQLKVKIAMEDLSIREYLTKLIVNDLQKGNK